MSDGGTEQGLRGEQRTVAVIGLGYVGLPLAMLFADKGFHVLGIDSDVRKIEALNNGKSYIQEIADSDIQAILASGRLTPTGDSSMLATAEAVIICVPTPLSSGGTPDLSYLVRAAEDIGRHVRRDQLIVLESSTFPGTTREVVLPILEQSGWKAGADFHLAYSPERIDPGNREYPVEKIPKVVSGITPDSLIRVEELYGHLFPLVYPVSSLESAELTKIVENAYRLVNISFMNEMAMICDAMNLDVWEIIQAAKTKPFGFHAFYPGPGIGGHCIPVDPAYLQWKLREYGIGSEYIAISNTLNRRMPHYVAEQITRHLAPELSLAQARIVVYGAAYKRDIADSRESSSIELLQILLEQGAEAVYHDPYIPSLAVGNRLMSSVELTEELVRTSDCVVIMTDHSAIPLPLLLKHAQLIYDTRNATEGLHGRARIVRLGGGITSPRQEPDSDREPQPKSEQLSKLQTEHESGLHPKPQGLKGGEAG